MFILVTVLRLLFPIVPLSPLNKMIIIYDHESCDGYIIDDDNNDDDDEFDRGGDDDDDDNL